jgi:hypothetical protein
MYSIYDAPLPAHNGPLKTPTQVTLSTFIMDWARLCGTCALSLDDALVAQRLPLLLGKDGRLIVKSSDLGPELLNALHSADTKRAINDALSLLLPKFSSLNCSPPPSESLESPSHWMKRLLDRAGFETAVQLISGAAFSVTVGTSGRADLLLALAPDTERQAAVLSHLAQPLAPAKR